MENKLIIIEDDSRMREIINDYFTAKGFAVFEAVDGADALEKLENAEYDIAFLDIMMPNMNGYELLNVLRSNVKTQLIPVIILSAKAGEDSMIEGTSKNYYIVC